MHVSEQILVIFSTFTAISTALASQAPLLQATALVTTKESTSALQCWEFNQPFTVSNQAGISGSAVLSLANSSDVKLTTIPPFFDGGLHKAPTVQFVVFLTGLAHITLPSSTSSVHIVGGSANSLIVAADTTGAGHFTSYPSNEFTTALQVPVKGGLESMPAHSIVDRDGPCRSSKQIIRSREGDRGGTIGSGVEKKRGLMGAFYDALGGGKDESNRKIEV